MSQSAAEHRSQSPSSLGCAVVTVSDTRTEATDTGGKAVANYLVQAGHRVVDRRIVRDEPDQMRPLLLAYRDQSDIDAVLLTGGTGVTSRDQTFETVAGLLTKTLPGFGELFRVLSYQEIGAAAMLSRAVGGLLGGTVILTMPGSPAAVQLAMQKLILPELPHLVREARR